MSELKCPNCNMPLAAVLSTLASQGQTATDDDAIAVVLAWPRCRQARLYQLLHDVIGLRRDAVLGIIARGEQ